MENNNRVLEKWLIIVSIIGLASFIVLYRHVSPHSSIKLLESKQDILQASSSILHKLKYEPTEYKPRIGFYQDGKKLQYVTSHFPFSEAQKIMQNDIPVYFWNVSYRKSAGLFNTVDKSQEDVEVSIGPDGLQKITGNLRMRLSQDGKLIEFDNWSKITVSSDTTAQADARQIAEDAAQTFVGPSFSNYELQQIYQDSTYTFKWLADSTLWGMKVGIEIVVQGTHIIRYHHSYIPPEELNKLQSENDVIAILEVLLMLIYTIAVAFIIVQRLRRDEVSIRNGLRLSIIAGFGFVLNFWTMTNDDTLAGFIIPLIFIPTFIILSLLAIIGAAESTSRDIWPEKLRSYDAIIRIRILNRSVARSLARGIGLTFILLGIFACYHWIVQHFTGVFYSIENENITSIVLGIPALSIIVTSFSAVCYNEFIFRIFTLSFLRRRLDSQWAIVIIASIIWGINFLGDQYLLVFPIQLRIIYNFLIGIVLCLFLIRYDVLTLLVGSLGFAVFSKSQAMLYWGSTFHFWQGLLPWLALLGLIIIVWIGLRRAMNIDLLSDLTPPYVSRMNERERMKRELEIARKVQISFLPKTIPEIPLLDIATLCIPATEIGGDYYDFIRLNEHQLGIVIGDVSGKGISAAFHMTLAKGFLKSQARRDNSPREVMKRLNELFYENVERGTFISMIYGIFDVREKTFTFTRAGHNPVIIRSIAFDNIEDLCPDGIALGLTGSDIFDHHMEEQTIGIRTGDIFILYTDGISEAMNNQKDEFGEDRLHKIIQSQHRASAEELVNYIHEKINSFVGKTPQHDDMTLLVIKIL
ncbi:SpoIIE family protein phosphatase [candidate division KSB1 bacterium]|nr:SpoIIE family protein phosphatase [candidate division KSB1 bacterium]